MGHKGGVVTSGADFIIIWPVILPFIWISKRILSHQKRKTWVGVVQGSEWQQTGDLLGWIVFVELALGNFKKSNKMQA